MLDQAVRYGAILAQPEFKRGGKLLEIGSGSRGIAAFNLKEAVGVDPLFREKPAPGLIAIQASATALPLRTGCFDRVVCSDVLEHLDASDRPAAIWEMIRVARGTIFLACPCGDGARKVDRRLAGLYRFSRIRWPDWLEEHLQKRIPDADQIRDALLQQGATWREISGESTLMHFIVSLLISSRFLNRLWASIFSGKPRRVDLFARLRLMPHSRPYRRLWVIHTAGEGQSKTV